MRGSCTAFCLQLAWLCPAVFGVAVGCGVREKLPSGQEGSDAGKPAEEATDPDKASSGSKAGAMSQTSGSPSATGSAGLSAAGTSATSGTGAPMTMMMTAVSGTGGTSASSTAGTAAASGDAGATDSGTMMPTTPDSYPQVEAAQIGMPVKLSEEFKLAEGPLWHACQKKMLFSDVNNDVIHTIEADGSFGVFRMDTNYVNGMTFDMTGRLVQAEMGGNDGGRITRLEKDGTLTVLADKNPRGGKLNTSDDLIVRSDGTIYFSDPIIAHGPNGGVSITSKPLYRIPADMPGMVVEEAQMALPNGVDLSPDEKTLYVAEYLGGVVSSFDVADDGSLSGRKTFLRGLTNPDSMCLDAAGNLYVGVSSGLLIARPDGTRIKTVAMTTNRGVTSCEFGGEDGKTLFITAWASLWKIENMPVPGLEWSQNQQIACDP